MSKNDDRTLVSFDWAMKRILRDKANFDVLNGFLSILLNEDITVTGLLESEANQDYVRDKFNRVDLLVEDATGYQFIIEVQYSYSSSYLKRILFGAAKLITDNIESGEDYEKVPKIFSISLLYFPFSDEKMDDDYVYYGNTEFYGLHSGKPLSVPQNTLRTEKKDKKKGAKKSADESRMEDTDPESHDPESHDTASNEASENEPSEETSTLTSRQIARRKGNIFPEFYLIEVGRFPDEVKDALDEWIYFFKHSEILDEFTSKNIQKARTKLKLIQMEREERRAYERFLEARTSYHNELSSAKEEGLVEGHEKGLAEGHEKGLAEGAEAATSQIIQSMLSNGLSVEQIVQMTGLSTEQILQVQSE
ncbi:MAG: PD-(D/E)XK nuclease family transposase [Bacteroidota bacterium]